VVALVFLLWVEQDRKYGRNLVKTWEPKSLLACNFRMRDLLIIVLCGGESIMFLSDLFTDYVLHSNKLLCCSHWGQCTRDTPR
jgi:hypothetical protein